MAADTDEEDLIRQIEDELKQPFTDSVKESTVDYYLQNKLKVSPYMLVPIRLLFQTKLCQV